MNPDATPEAGHRAGSAVGVVPLAAAVAVAAASALLGVAAGYVWAALAPRPLLQMTSRGAATLVNAETTAFISADGIFCLVCLVAGVAAGVGGYLLAVRRWGPLPMLGLLLGGVAGALVARWVGQHDGLAAFHHLLATLPPGARLHAALTLGATSALALWPLAAGLVAGALVVLATQEPHGSAPPGDAGKPRLSWGG